MKASVYNQQGEEVGTTLLPKEIFDVKLNYDLIHQVAVGQISNRRKVIANTKDRSEVRGGGKKPWRQKGTGRARHGSIRSPLWRHGGISFGPQKEKNFKKTIPEKMRRKALFQVLSAKAKDNFLIILDEFSLLKPKTKILAKLLADLKTKIADFKQGSVLIVLPKAEKSLILSAQNLPKIKTMEARNLNVLDVLSSKYLLMPKESIKVIKETFLK